MFYDLTLLWPVRIAHDLYPARFRFAAGTTHYLIRILMFSLATYVARVRERDTLATYTFATASPPPA